MASMINSMKYFIRNNAIPAQNVSENRRGGRNMCQLNERNYIRKQETYKLSALIDI